MKYTLKIKVLNDTPLLKWNYKHKLSSVIYNLITKNNKEYSDVLHNSKKIASYAYSNLNIDRYKTNNVGILILSPYVYLNISSFNGELNKIIHNFKKECFVIDDNFFQIDDIIHGDIMFDSNDILESDVIIRQKNTKGVIITNEDIYSEKYKKTFFNNLIKKYNNITNDNKKFDVENMNLTILNCKTGLEIFKKNNEDFKLKYYTIKYKLDCPLELRKIAYMCGVGENNQIGFGYVNIINK